MYNFKLAAMAELVDARLSGGRDPKVIRVRVSLAVYFIDNDLK